MSEVCDLNIEVVSRHLLGRNKEGILQAHANLVDTRVLNGVDYPSNCIFVDELRFDINMRCNCGWSKCGTEVVITTPSARDVYHTVIGAVNLSMRESGDVKRRNFVGSMKRKAPRYNLHLTRQNLTILGFVKGKVKRNKLSDVESLTTRIIEASEAVTVDYLRGFIQNSVNQFENYINKVAI